ncbi:MAG: hypothetical protein ABIN89_01630 [Chitinophagaceae bacterium]
MTINLPFAFVVVGCIICIIGGGLASLYSFRNTRDLHLVEQENRSLVEYTQKIEKRNQALARKNEDLNTDNRVLNQKIYDLSNKIIELNPSSVISKDVERYLSETMEKISQDGEINPGKSDSGKK